MIRTAYDLARYDIDIIPYVYVCSIEISICYMYGQLHSTYGTGTGCMECYHVVAMRMYGKSIKYVYVFIFI